MGWSKNIEWYDGVFKCKVQGPVLNTQQKAFYMQNVTDINLHGLKQHYEPSSALMDIKMSTSKRQD
jgi:hypothetical protein